MSAGCWFQPAGFASVQTETGVQGMGGLTISEPFLVSLRQKNAGEEFWECGFSVEIRRVKH